MNFSRRIFLGQPPRIAVLLQLVHDIIGNSVALFFCQFPRKAAHQFAGTSQRERNSETQQVPAGTHVYENRWRTTWQAACGKRKLAKLLRAPHLGIVLNEHYEGDGEIIFKHACKLAFTWPVGLSDR